MNLFKLLFNANQVPIPNSDILLLEFTKEALTFGKTVAGYVEFKEKKIANHGLSITVHVAKIKNGIKAIEGNLVGYLNKYQYVHLSTGNPESLVSHYNEVIDIFTQHRECSIITASSAGEAIYSGKEFVLENALSPQQGQLIENILIPTKQLLKELSIFLQNTCLFKKFCLWEYLVCHLQIGLVYNFKYITMSQTMECSDLPLGRVLETIANNYLIPTDKAVLLENSYLEYYNSDIKEIVLNNLRQYSFLTSRKNILLVAPDFEIGGGQILIVRIANFLSTYHNVYLYNARPSLKKSSIVSMLLPSVKILTSTGEAKDLNQYINSLHIDIVNSHIWWADKLVYYAVKDSKHVRWVLCMHGCYEALLENPDWDSDFKNIVKEVLLTADYDVYVTPKNHRIFEYLNLDGEQIRQIYTGYERQALIPYTRQELNISESSIIFGIVSRAIPEKGWEEAICATIRLNKLFPCDLLLVGTGQYADQLKIKYREYSFIHFVNATKYPSEWISYVQLFDVAMLPTYFISESLPNAVIEYLAYNKPVISTNIGEIKKMVSSEDGRHAGIILELENNYLKVDDLYEAMKKMAEDSFYRATCAQNARHMFSQFDMKNFINRYGELFFSKGGFENDLSKGNK